MALPDLYLPPADNSYSSSNSLAGSGSVNLPSSSEVMGGWTQEFNNTAPMYTDSGNDDSFWGGVWDWANSDMGLAVLGGAITGISDAWDTDYKAKSWRSGGGGGSGGSGGPSPAELQDKRIKKHNESINKPMDMGLIKFKEK